MSALQTTTKVSADDLRDEVRKESAEVALDPHKGYHFDTGRAAADRLGYDPSLYNGLPVPRRDRRPWSIFLCGLAELPVVCRRQTF